MQPASLAIYYYNIIYRGCWLLVNRVTEPFSSIIYIISSVYNVCRVHQYNTHIICRTQGLVEPRRYIILIIHLFKSLFLDFLAKLAANYIS